MGPAEIFERQAGARGVAAPAAHVGKRDPAVVVVGPFGQELSEVLLGRVEVAGPALQLGDPEAVLEAAGLAAATSAIGRERLGKPAFAAQAAGFAPELGGRACGRLRGAEPAVSRSARVARATLRDADAGRGHGRGRLRDVGRGGRDTRAVQGECLTSRGGCRCRASVYSGGWSSAHCGAPIPRGRARIARRGWPVSRSGEGQC